MAVRSFNSTEVKNDLYNRIVGPEETNLLLGDTTRGDISPTGYYGDLTSSATDNYPDVIKPTSQVGNGRWIKMFGTVPIGALLMWPTTTAPGGWFICNGAAISRTTYALLFSIIGTTYGTGDGSTTFNLPDMRQRFPLGLAASGTGNAIAATGGTIDHLHTVDPGSTSTSSDGSHNHTGVTGTPSATVAATNLTGSAASTTHTHTISSDGAHTHTVDIGSFNSGTANPPFLVVNFIIKT